MEPPPSCALCARAHILRRRRGAVIDDNMRRLMFTTATGPVAHELAEDVITIGRAPENMIRLDDSSVSGRHAQLTVTGDSYELRDVGSTNGTCVNGETVMTATLKAGDRIRFGKVEACFECPVPTEGQ